MDSLRRLIKAWSADVRALDSVLQERESDRGIDDTRPDKATDESQYLAFQLALRIGQSHDAIETLAALDGEQTRGPEDVAAMTIWDRRGQSGNSIELARGELVSQAAALRLHQPQDFEDLFAAVCDFRRLVAASHVIPDIDPEVLRILGVKLEADTARLSEEDRLYFRDAVRNLISDYWLYPGITRSQRDRVRNGYPAIYRMASISNEGEGMKPIEGLERALREMQLDGSIKDLVTDILKRIADVTVEDGLGVFESASGDGRYVTGGSSDVMVIPGTGQGPCRPVLMAIAGSRNRGDRSPKNVIKRMQEVLVECSPKVQIAIFLSDAAGMGAVLENNLGLLEAHIRRGSLKGFLPVVVVGRRLTLIDWRG